MNDVLYSCVLFCVSLCLWMSLLHNTRFVPSFLSLLLYLYSLLSHIIITDDMIVIIIIIITATTTVPLRIVEHFANPPLVGNCSQTSLTCKISSPYRSSDLVVFWTFRGENASKLKDIEFSSHSVSNEWQLILLCPTLSHAGTYACIAHPSNDSSILYKKEAVIQVYGEFQWGSKEYINGKTSKEGKEDRLHSSFFSNLYFGLLVSPNLWVTSFLVI